MTALNIPPEVAAECAKKLFTLAASANRDSMTLVKQAMLLAKNEQVARPLGVLKKYVREYDQYGSGEVSEVIASIETVADPEHVKRLARGQAKYDAERAEFEQRQQDEAERSWEPDGEAWDYAIETMHTDAETLARAAETMKQGKGGKNLLNAVRGYYETEGRSRSLWRLRRYTPTNRESGRVVPVPKGSNVVSGPWLEGA